MHDVGAGRVLDVEPRGDGENCLYSLLLEQLLVDGRGVVAKPERPEVALWFEDGVHAFVGVVEAEEHAISVSRIGFAEIY